VTTGVQHTSKLIMGQLVLTAGQLLPHVLEAAEEACIDVLQSSHLTLLACQACLYSQQSCGMLISSLLPGPLPLAPLQMLCVSGNRPTVMTCIGISLTSVCRAQPHYWPLSL
jgi:hypothetical protein